MKVILKDKREVVIDLYALTLGEVRSLLETKKKEHDGDAILGKAVGMTDKELASLPFPDYRKITRAFWECVRDPLKDEDDIKNSQSESIST